MIYLDATGLFLQRNRNFLLISKKSMFWHPSTSICKFSKTPELLRECKFHKFCFHCVLVRWTSFRNVIWTVFLSLKFVIKSKCQFDLFLKFLSNHLLGKNTVWQNTARKNRSSKVEYRHTVLHESTWFNNLQLWVKTIKIIYKYENDIICIFSFYRFSKESWTTTLTFQNVCTHKSTAIKKKNNFHFTSAVFTMLGKKWLWQYCHFMYTLH